MSLSFVFVNNTIVIPVQSHITSLEEWFQNHKIKINTIKLPLLSVAKL